MVGKDSKVRHKNGIYIKEVTDGEFIVIIPQELTLAQIKLPYIIKHGQ